jgi:hypothetical protein
MYNKTLKKDVAKVCDLYSVLEIKENLPDELNTFTTFNLAKTFFINRIKQSYPYLNKKFLETALQMRFLSDENYSISLLSHVVVRLNPTQNPTETELNNLKTATKETDLVIA